MPGEAAQARGPADAMPVLPGVAVTLPGYAHSAIIIMVISTVAVRAADRKAPRLEQDSHSAALP